MIASSSSDDGSKDIDAVLYNAAIEGDFEKFENYAQPLDRLLSPNKNTILHIHLNSSLKRSKVFVEKVLGKCPQLLWQTNNDGTVPLHIAATYGQLEMVKVFIEEAEKERIHRDLETGEVEAEDSNSRRMLRLTNKQKETALHLAIRVRCLDVVKEILEHEDPKYTYTANVSGESPLYLSLDMNIYDDRIAIEILNKFESPDCGGPNGKTAFHLTAIHNIFSLRLLDLMLSKLGSFVNQADESGWTPLHYATFTNHKEFVRQILGKDKRSAYATDKERSRTALHLASCRDNVEIMHDIIEKCPECCEIRDVRGWNVLHYAVISNSVEAVNLIVTKSSLMYLTAEQDVKGYTPYHLLTESRHIKGYIPWGLPFSALKYRPAEKDKIKKEILEWMNDLGRGPFGETIEVKKVPKDWSELQKEREESVIPELEKAKDSHLVAAALVATVTFAAAFTLPGGYISDDNDSNLKGSPILSRNAAFQAFVITDAIAMVLSTSSVFIYFIMVLLEYKQRYYWLMRSAFWFVVLAMGAMVVAFVTGTYAVLAPNSNWLAIATCVIGLTFFLHVFYTIIRLIFGFIKRDKEESVYPSTIESFRRLSKATPRYLSWGHKKDEE